MITVEDVEAARATLEGITVKTPVLASDRLSQDVGADILVKAENAQRAGSFKLRGAYVKMASLSAAERQRGVIAHSAGNHAQGVALAARLLGIPAVVVMPEYAPLAKVVATRRYGAEVILHGASFDDAGEYARQLQRRRGLCYVHAFDDPKTVAGQGTLGLELIEDLPEVDTVIVPVGGGGLIAGVALVLRARRPEVQIIGVQAEGCPSIRLSLAAGQPVVVPEARTIADGIAVKRPGEITLPLIRDLVDEMITVDEDEIARGIVYALQNLRQVAEGGGAVGIAALLARKIRPRPEEQVAVVLSGGNIDANFLARVIEQVLVKQGRYVVLHTTVPDRPGNLAPLVNRVAEAGANIIDIHHRRAAWQVAVDRVGIELILEVRDEEHAGELIRELTGHGYEVERAGAGEYPE
ncbi:MAG: threonine ammonia-lyase [Chloroflexota bacterium]|nr:threonine ammonia-lyase [Chloroflexota bacterium]